MGDKFAEDIALHEAGFTRCGQADKHDVRNKLFVMFLFCLFLQSSHSVFHLTDLKSHQFQIDLSREERELFLINEFIQGLKLFCFPTVQKQ